MVVSAMWRNLTAPLLVRCLLGLTVGAVLWSILPDALTQRISFYVGSASQPKHGLPLNIEQDTMTRFDNLVQKGKIFYEDAEPEHYVHNGFEFEFRIVTMFEKKPVLAPDDPGRSKASGPFISQDPEEILVDLTSTHRLLLNKFCIYRPMLIVATKQYELQSDDLNVRDFDAVWPVLKAFSKPMLMIYNRGVNAGSSQGHKHMQLFPLPSYQIWPSQISIRDEIAINIANVPFKHFVISISSRDTPEDIYLKYHRLLQLTQDALIASDSLSRDYNVAMTAEWIALIPRRTAGPKGPFGANAPGMLGMVTVRNSGEREEWARLGYSSYLKELGIPF